MCAQQLPPCRRIYTVVRQSVSNVKGRASNMLPLWHVAPSTPHQSHSCAADHAATNAFFAFVFVVVLVLVEVMHDDGNYCHTHVCSFSHSWAEGSSVLSTCDGGRGRRHAPLTAHTSGQGCSSATCTHTCYTTRIKKERIL